MTLSLFGFVTCLQSHISLSDECDTPLSTSECFWLRLNRQSFYHYRKRQLVPTDRYRFRSIGKLIGSVSHDRVAYRYLDAFPKCLPGLEVFNNELMENTHLSALICIQSIDNVCRVWRRCPESNAINITTFKVKNLVLQTKFLRWA